MLENKNPNYSAHVFKITELRKHSNADRLQCVTVLGCNVITGLDAKLGDVYVYFPLECSINLDFLTATESLKPKGFFEPTGRVKALKLRGEKSEGYIVPVKTVEDFFKVSLPVGTDVDTINGVSLCRKYFNKQVQIDTKRKDKQQKKVFVSRLLNFKLHEDTEQFKRNIHRFSPDDIVAVTEKIHGSNFVVGRELATKRLRLRDRIAKWFGVPVVDTEYTLAYASRRVIKSETNGQHYYKEDVWKKIADRIFPFLRDGYCVYGEIIGPGIQKGYDYGIPEGEVGFFVFKVTHHGLALSHPQMIEFCLKNEFPTPKTHYYGRFADMPPLDFVEDRTCTLCTTGVPAEGVVIRKESAYWQAYKLKAFAFLQRETKELDAGGEVTEDDN